MYSHSQNWVHIGLEKCLPASRSHSQLAVLFWVTFLTVLWSAQVLHLGHHVVWALTSFSFLAFIASSLSFMDSCDFELENICGMIQSSGDSADWQWVSQVLGGPENDHSNMGQCKGNSLSPVALAFLFSLIDWCFVSLFFENYYWF